MLDQSEAESPSGTPSLLEAAGAADALGAAETGRAVNAVAATSTIVQASRATESHAIRQVRHAADIRIFERANSFSPVVM